MKKAIAIIWYIWANRRGLKVLRDEIVDIYEVSEIALQDSKITKKEALGIIKEIKEVFPPIVQLLGGK